MQEWNIAEAEQETGPLCLPHPASYPTGRLWKEKNNSLEVGLGTVP